LRRPFPDIPLLLTALAAPLLPPPWSALVLLALVALWLWRRPPQREVVVVGVALLAATAALAAQWALRPAAEVPREVWLREAGRGYARLWDELRGRAVEAAAAVAPGPAAEAVDSALVTPASQLTAFRRLAALAPGRGAGRRALLLVDPDGSPVAWAGEGLLHELAASELPRSGLDYQAGSGAATLFAVQPLDGGRRPWRVVAGVSLATATLPFAAPERARRWTLVDRPDQAAKGALVVPLKGAPLLVVGPALGRPPAPPRWLRGLAWGALAVALLALAVMRGVGLVLQPRRGGEAAERRGWIAALALGGFVGAGAAAALPPATLAALAAGLALAAGGLGLLEVPARLRRSHRTSVVLGAVAVPLLTVAAWGLAHGEPPDLAGDLLVPPGPFGLRLALAAAALGLLAGAGRLAPPGTPPRDRWGWLAVGLLLAGAAAHDLPLLALALLGAGGAVAAFWSADRRWPEQPLALAALALLAALAAGGAWETAYRLRLRQFVAGDLLERLAPPPAATLRRVAAGLDRHFRGRDVTALAPRVPLGLERQDLAFTLWSESPLARGDARSALVAEGHDGVRSSFAFGLPLDAQGRIDTSPERWPGSRLALDRALLLRGMAPLVVPEGTWGTVRWWLLPEPGFRAASPRRLSGVAEGLLRGEPAAAEPAGLPEAALFALYDEEGRAVRSPWEETPPLPAALRRAAARAPAQGTVRTPAGPAAACVRAVPEGWAVVFVPGLTPFQALERVATWALGTLFLAALATGAALLLALPRAAFRDALRRAVRSYSKRLLIVTTLLLLLPLLILNAILVRSTEERLIAARRAAGEAALNTVQKVLGDYILTFAPGFGLDTALNDDLLVWLSRVTRHEVNLYWGSEVYASSRHELFTAGLLPKRIPGEIFSRLALRGYPLSSRTNRAGETAYLELYAPLRVPGVPAAEARLFLSMPLLAQQEEAARDLAHLRRHGLLVSSGLFALLLAVATHLARNFTRPLTELVEGTRRIAAGAPALDLAPTELELAALVEAVDQMARRIADARERLVREKQVVERMVENITSGVVSLDAEGRVLMHNRVAAEMLGAEVGESLEAALGRAPRLLPVAAFLHGAGAEPRRTTVRLPAAAGGEREWTLIWVPVPGTGEPAALLVVEDATEVLRGQRLLAWAEMARIIAHEIKNPLTPIRLSAEHMREVLASDPEHFDEVFERCTTNILAQVEELRQIAAEFSAYSSIPRIDPRPGDLGRAVGELVEVYRTAPPDGVEVAFRGPGGPLPARFDARLLGRAVRNLLENALRASAGGGRVEVRVEDGGGEARIVVADTGPGVAPEILPRIFDPYFSTHDAGTGLGLPITRRIAEEHGGRITARNRPGGGLEVTITLPITLPAAPGSG
jgi:signal transduction histidine kinase